MSNLDDDANLNRAREVEGYKILPPCVLYGRIGQGGMGAVYRGRHLNLDIDVAVKCLKPELTGEDEQFVVRFKREARAAARINHQNVVRVFDVSEEAGLHYIVMELVQGETARQRVQRKQRLAVGEALEIVWAAAQGLGEAHLKGFVHRDVKPDNILISSSGQVKVADLGLAKPAAGGASLLSGTNFIMGTPQYMPPEQWENTATVTAAADVWALGATLYYLLVGGEAIAKDSLPRIMQRIVMQPFPDVRQARPDVPEDVAALIAKATCKEPGERFADGQEMARAIEALATRRENLRDAGATADCEQPTLLSPPPAKTLARIKFWLDGQTATAEVGRDAATVTGPAPRNAGRRSSSAGIVMAVSALLLVAMALLVWQPWRARPFAEADRLEQQGRFEEALAAVVAVTREEPGLAGEVDRRARLLRRQAEQCLAAGDLEGALTHVAMSLAVVDAPTTRSLQHRIRGRVVAELDAQLAERSPRDAIASPDGRVTWRGSVRHPLLVSFRIDGRLVDRGADGAFAATVDVADRELIPVAATLATGDELPLAAFVVGRRAPEVAAAPTTPDPAREGAADAVAGSGGGENRAVGIAPEALLLPVEGAARLTVTAPVDAEIEIDGRRVARAVGQREHVHEVRSELDAPAPVTIVVRVPGSPDVRRTVPVQRATATLAFVRPPAVQGVRQLRDRLPAIGDATVVVTGALGTRADRVLVNGVDLADVEWQGTVFRGVTSLALGENVLRVEAMRRFHQSAVTELRVLRLAPPAPALADGAPADREVAAPTADVAVVVDPYTVLVEATVGSRRVQLTRDRDADVFRGRVPLEVGQNEVAVRASNVLDQEGSLDLRITRQAASARPEVASVQVRVEGSAQEVRAGQQVFLREAAGMFVEVSDPAATLEVNGEVVERGADGAVPIRQWLGDSRATPIEIVARNDVGSSTAFKFFAWLDATLPEAECKAPAAVVRPDTPILLFGTWRDDGGLDPERCTIGDVPVELSPRGVAKQGTWKVTHPGLAATETLELVFTDRAGNRTTLPLRIEVAN